MISSRIKFAVLLLLPAVALSSCIKEDRGPCPTLYELNILYDSDQEVNLPCRLDIWEEDANYYFTDEFRLEELPLTQEGAYWYKYKARVRKGDGVVCNATGVEKSLRAGNMVLIPKGQQSDRLWASNHKVKFEGEFTSDTMSVNKQYCHLDIVFDHGAQNLDIRTISVKGNVSGLDLLTLKPVHGDFLYSFPDGPETKCLTRAGGNDNKVTYSIRLPRQDSTDELVIEFRDGTNHHRYSLRNLLAAASPGPYDWAKTDLDDAELCFSQLSINGDADPTVTIVSPWASGGDIDAEI